MAVYFKILLFQLVATVNFTQEMLAHIVSSLRVPTPETSTLSWLRMMAQNCQNARYLLFSSSFLPILWSRKPRFDLQ